jgi:hypothetical protein
MSVLRDVMEELFSMFAGDAWLSLGILIVVAAAALASVYAIPLLGGAILLAGSLGILVGAVLRATRRSK